MELKPSFVIYIDESGDEGFKFGDGSSEWFVLAAAVTRKHIDLETVKLVDRVRNRLGREPRSKLHFRDLKHEQRVVFCDEMARAPIQIVAVLIHKPSLEEKEMFQEKNRLYFYFTRYLIERVSWLCHDLRENDDPGDGISELVFSKRKDMSYEDMRAYFGKLQRIGQSHSHPNYDLIDWNVIRPDSRYLKEYSPMKRMGLLTADAVAGSFYYAVERNRYGHTEDRYVTMLRPVVYRRQGQVLNYGVKFAPTAVENKAEQGAFAWINEL